MPYDSTPYKTMAASVSATATPNTTPVRRRAILRRQGSHSRSTSDSAVRIGRAGSTRWIDLRTAATRVFSVAVQSAGWDAPMGAALPPGSIAALRPSEFLGSRVLSHAHYLVWSSSCRCHRRRNVHSRGFRPRKNRLAKDSLITQICGPPPRSLSRISRPKTMGTPNVRSNLGRPHPSQSRGRRLRWSETLDLDPRGGIPAAEHAKVRKTRRPHTGDTPEVRRGICPSRLFWRAAS